MMGVGGVHPVKPLAALDRGHGLKHALQERTSARGSQPSRLEMVVTWGTGPSVLRVNRNACATEKNACAARAEHREINMVVTWGAG
jgi:hypothetical protein